jgi:hypothetical protein
MFMDCETKGMLLECACEVAHSNEPDKIAIAEESDAIALTNKPKGGPISKNAARLCQDPWFQQWAVKGTHRAPCGVTAKERLYEYCDIESRAELDHDPEAAQRYEEMKGYFIRFCQQEQGPRP